MLQVTLLLIGIVLFWSFTLYGLNRGDDRLQLATVCLFMTNIAYAIAVWQLHEKGASPVLVGAVLALAGCFYVANAAMAITFKRWAWQVAVIAFSLQLLSSLAGLVMVLSRGAPLVIGMLQSIALACVGLWASLHPGSRKLVQAQTAAA